MKQNVWIIINLNWTNYVNCCKPSNYVISILTKKKKSNGYEAYIYYPTYHFNICRLMEAITFPHNVLFVAFNIRVADFPLFLTVPKWMNCVEPTNSDSRRIRSGLKKIYHLNMPPPLRLLFISDSTYVQKGHIRRSYIYLLKKHFFKIK